MSRVRIIEDGVIRVDKTIASWDGTPPPTKGKAGPQIWSKPMVDAIKARFAKGEDVTLTVAKVNGNSWSIKLT